MTDQHFRIDRGTPFGERAAAHLRDELVVWLTTVSAAGSPQPSPVWFLWDGADRVLVHSRDGTARTRNIAANPRVSLNFGGDGRGGDIVVLSGRAEVAADVGPADGDPGYLAKYAAGIERIGMTAEQFSSAYPVPIRVTLTGLRGH